MDKARLEQMRAHADEGGHFGRPILSELLTEVEKTRAVLEDIDSGWLGDFPLGPETEDPKGIVSIHPDHKTLWLKIRAVLN